jgi:N-acetylmuramoyl-L-alanine amidase
VIDPAHGGADTGARGASGIIESDLVLSFARLLRISLEAQGLRVILTRQGNEDPSFDDRSQKANSERGAIFITLHASSTGLPGTVRVYSLGQEAAPVPAPPATAARVQLVPWNNAQQMYVDSSQKLAAFVQTEMMQRFPGSPDMPAAAAIRQLRTVAAPAIAVEVSSVNVPDRTALDKMAPILAEGVAHGVAMFRPIYEAGAN